MTSGFGPKETKIVTTEKKPRREVLEEYLLTLGFQSGHWDWLHKRNLTSLVKTYRFARILETFDQLYLLDLGNFLEDEEKLAKEYQKALGHLEKIDLIEKLKGISDKIKSLEKQKNLSPEEQKR